MTPTHSAEPAATGEESSLAAGLFTIFRLKGWYLAVPLEESAGILEPVPLTPVPEAPEGLLGLVPFRGEVLAVLDTGLLLGLGSSGGREPGRLFFVRYGGEPVGLAVDGVEDLAQVRPVSLASVDLALPPGLRASASGFFRWRDHPVVGLSLDRLLA